MTGYPTIVDDIRAALDELAALGAPHRIAAQLDADGDRGLIDSTSACPIAVRLERLIPDLDVEYLAVNQDCLTYDGVPVPLPLPVALFGLRFDEHRYPSLITGPLAAYSAGWESATADLGMEIA